VVVEVGLQEEAVVPLLQLLIHLLDQMDLVVLIMVELVEQEQQHILQVLQFHMQVVVVDKIIETLQEQELVLQMVLVD
jgi:hypothetical protein